MESKNRTVMKVCSALLVVCLMTGGVPVAALASDMISVTSPETASAFVPVIAYGIDKDDNIETALAFAEKNPGIVGRAYPGIVPVSDRKAAQNTSAATTSSATTTQASTTSSTKNTASNNSTTANAATGASGSQQTMTHDQFVALVDWKNGDGYYGYRSYSGTKVYWTGTKYAERFHIIKGCSKNATIELTIKEAVDDKRLTPCETCFRKN